VEELDEAVVRYGRRSGLMGDGALSERIRWPERARVRIEAHGGREI
jgi:hypothetical protein